MPKRKRYDWANKIDPETGVHTRFCTRCEAFLTMDHFYPSHVKNGSLACKVCTGSESKAAIKRWMLNNRGEPGSVQRIRSNLNTWIRREKKGRRRWTDADVVQALQRHKVDLATETRIVRLRPRDPQLPFNADNSVVKFQIVSCTKHKQKPK